MRDSDRRLRTTRTPRVIPLTEAPREAWLWVLRAGLSPEEANDVWGFRWAPEQERVIVPVLPLGDAWVARSVDPKRKPKYISSNNAKGRFWTGGNVKADVTIVVEDILSAIACVRAGFRAVAAMGTATDQIELVAEACATGHVIGWFDPDRAGEAAALRFKKACRLWPVQYGRIRSERDPKLHTQQEIRDFVHIVKGDSSAGPEPTADM